MNTLNTIAREFPIVLNTNMLIAGGFVLFVVVALAIVKK